MSLPAMPPGPPILIALPSGLVTSGVVAWAVRLANAFANQGRLAGLILHTPSKGYAPLDVALHYNVRVHDLSDLPPLDAVNGDLTPFIPRYRDALHDLALASGHPVALSPNLLGDCYGIAAAISMVEPEILRILGWGHVDLPYEATILKHYEPCIARFAGCSHALVERLAASVPHRRHHLAHLPYGVTIPASPQREPYQGQRPLRLIYSGRIEQDVKRVGAIICLSDELARRGVAHELTLLGDGPAAAEIDRACAARRSITRLPAVSSERVHAILSQQDIFVMASRVEGLSISLLESLACGCVPVITRTRSGSAEAITDGVDGRLIDWEGQLASITTSTNADTHAQHARLGELLADGVCDVVSRNLATLSRNAIAKAKAHFTHESHVARTMAIVDEVAAEAPRAWPAYRPSAFTSPIAAGAHHGTTAANPAATTPTFAPSGTVPAHAAERLRHTLSTLAGRRIIIHGTGRHTLELAHVLANYTTPQANSPTIVAFTDDDPTRQGSSILGLPVIAPHAAATIAQGQPGASDVIISSYINQNDIWQRRGIYEAKGLAVHRLYPEAA